MSDVDKFTVPEPPVGIGQGFLSEYWQSEEPLPKIKGWRVVVYYLQQGMETLKALPMSSFITISTIALSLFLLSCFMLLLINVDRIISAAGSSLYLTVYLKEGLAGPEVERFVKRCEDNPRFRSVKFISKTEALQSLRDDLGSRSGFLEGLDEDNPLPDSVDIVLLPDELGVNSTERIVQALRENEVVEEVVYGTEWVERMKGVLRIFRIIAGFTLCVALGVVVFLIMFTIKLVLYARRDEIAIMQLVGASDRFVRIPFMLAGLIQGMVGSVVGLLLLKLFSLIFSIDLRGDLAFGIAPHLVFFDYRASIAIVVVGVTVGTVGSLFALGKFMDV